MGRLRRRLDRLENNAHETMDDASETLAVIRDFILDLQDGIEFELEVAGKPIPVKLRIKVAEDPK